MKTFDITIRGGTIVDEDRTYEADVGIVGDRIVAVEPGLPPAPRDFDATGRFVLPGGVDTHCHVEQLSGMGRMSADNWYSASVSAAFGGTTTIVPFAAQHKGASLRQVADDYAALAAAQSVIDYSFHVIVTGTDAATIEEDLPALIRAGITSFKVYMTYEALKIDDYQMLEVLAVAARERALVMVHAENNDVIRWVSERLLDKGYRAPKFHGPSHAQLAESEATNRAIQLSRLLDVPILIVHVSEPEALAAIAAAQARGAAIYAETCPHYLLLTADAMDLPGTEGAKFCCSPPLRDVRSQDLLWEGLRNGTLQTLSSDHAPYRYDESGKIPQGQATSFKQVANGLPGIEARLPLLYSEGVRSGRLSLPEMVKVGIANHARLYGLYPRKGVLQPGSDADVAIWNPDREVILSADTLHDQTGYTPYEGRVVTGWPDIVISAGRVIVEDGTLHAEPGSGRFIARHSPAPCVEPRDRDASTLFYRSLADITD